MAKMNWAPHHSIDLCATTPKNANGEWKLAPKGPKPPPGKPPPEILRQHSGEGTPTGTTKAAELQVGSMAHMIAADRGLNRKTPTEPMAPLRAKAGGIGPPAVSEVPPQQAPPQKAAHGVAPKGVAAAGPPTLTVGNSHDNSNKIWEVKKVPKPPPKIPIPKPSQTGALPKPRATPSTPSSSSSSHAAAKPLNLEPCEAWKGASPVLMTSTAKAAAPSGGAKPKINLKQLTPELRSISSERMTKIAKTQEQQDVGSSVICIEDDEENGQGSARRILRPRAKSGTQAIHSIAKVPSVQEIFDVANDVDSPFEAMGITAADAGRVGITAPVATVESVGAGRTNAQHRKVIKRGIKQASRGQNVAKGAGRKYVSSARPDVAQQDERIGHVAAMPESLNVGDVAKIFGLQKAGDLNDIVVTLVRPHDAAQDRWIVQMPDELHKAIRTRNLLRLHNAQEDIDVDSKGEQGGDVAEEKRLVLESFTSVEMFDEAEEADQNVDEGVAEHVAVDGYGPLEDEYSGYSIPVETQMQVGCGEELEDERETADEVEEEEEEEEEEKQEEAEAEEHGLEEQNNEEREGARQDSGMTEEQPVESKTWLQAMDILEEKEPEEAELEELEGLLSLFSDLGGDLDELGLGELDLSTLQDTLSVDDLQEDFSVDDKNLTQACESNIPPEEHHEDGYNLDTCSQEQEQERLNVQAEIEALEAALGDAADHPYG